MSELVDTNVISELVRLRVNPGVADWARRTKRFSVSAVTLEEIEYGLSWKPNQRVRQWFEAFLTDFCDVVAISPSIARYAGRLRGQLQALGKVRSQADMLIGATAAVGGLTLITRNSADFDGCGIAVVNPFR